MPKLKQIPTLVYYKSNTRVKYETSDSLSIHPYIDTPGGSGNHQVSQVILG